MSSKSTIEWTESTWNPVTGCTKISEGCKNCYAERMAKRLQAMGNKNYSDGFKLKIHLDVLSLPFKWKKPQTIFVNSMSDLFHDAVPDSFIFKVFDVMRQTHWHKYQILTKRSDRLLQLSPKIEWSPNIWMGVSVENQDNTYRIDALRNTDAMIKFLSLEPLLGPINNLDLKHIDWVIVGGESGPKARIIKESWVIDIRDQCNINRIPFFFKQWGGVNKKKTGRELQGKYWSEVPKIALQYI
ncbi:MAG: phage Gp37/Gp68 family protein [Bacteroidetes bacterium]|jgi:protein gp37|nr:phage Gp37/Gp68 family protein [Bacteroidota bacterium]